MRAVTFLFLVKGKFLLNGKHHACTEYAKWRAFCNISVEYTKSVLLTIGYVWFLGWGLYQNKQWSWAARWHVNIVRRYHHTGLPDSLFCSMIIFLSQYMLCFQIIHLMELSLLEWVTLFHVFSSWNEWNHSSFNDSEYQ